MIRAIPEPAGVRAAPHASTADHTRAHIPAVFCSGRQKFALCAVVEGAHDRKVSKREGSSGWQAARAGERSLLNAHPNSAASATGRWGDGGGEEREGESV